MLTLNSDAAALSSQRNATLAQNNMSVSMERLSSGKRINSATDDAAGIQITQRITAQLGGIKIAERNANDGISIAQTAESALGSVQEMLQRMRELSVQASNDILNASDRKSIAGELNQLVEEINQVGERTMFNNNKLLDGTYKDKSFQIGANASETMSFSLGSVKTDTLGVSNQASVAAMGNANALAAGDLTINGITIGASFANDDTASYEEADGDSAKSAIAKVAAINEKAAETGVTATVNTNTVHGAAMGTIASGENDSIKINNVTISISTIQGDTAATRSAIVQAINAKSGQTGVIAINTDSDSGGVRLEAADGRNITISMGNNISAAESGIEGSTTATTSYGSYSLTSSSDIIIDRGSNNTAAALEHSGLREGTYSTQEASLSSIDDQGASWATGDVVINGIQIRETRGSDDAMSTGELTDKAKSAIAKAAAINNHTEDTGVWATVNTNSVDGSSMSGAAATGVMTINGVTTQSITTTTNTANSRELVVSAINAISDRTGVTAIDTGDDTNGIQLVAEDGRNIKISFDSNLTTGNTGVGGTDSAATTFEGSFTLHSAKAIEIGTMDESKMGTDFLDIGTYGNGISGEALSRLDISSTKGARNAISAIDNALEQVNEMRGDLGAKQNRLNYTISNLQATSENMTASRSRMEDADFATESTTLAKNKILQQASMAMLAQANQSSQSVLSLLQ